MVKSTMVCDRCQCEKAVAQPTDPFLSLSDYAQATASGWTNFPLWLDGTVHQFHLCETCTAATLEFINMGVS